MIIMTTRMQVWQSRNPQMWDMKYMLDLIQQQDKLMVFHQFG